MSQAQAGRDRIRLPDARPQRERPSVIKEKPGDIQADRHMNPKSAATAAAPKSYVMSSDKFQRQLPHAKNDPHTAKNMVSKHVAEKGGMGRPDIEAPTPGQPPKAMTGGLKVKSLQIVRPANAHPMISPSSGGPQGCVGNGKCLYGDAPTPVPALNTETFKPTLAIMEKVNSNDVATLHNPSSTLNPSTSAPPGAAKTEKPRQQTAPTQKARKDTIVLAPTANHSRPDDR